MAALGAAARKESRLPIPQNKKRSGYLFLAAGAMFFVAAWLGKQPAFYGIGAMFIALGAGALHRRGD